MATEELLLIVNDAQLKQALTQINLIKRAQSQTTGQVRGLSTLISQTRRDARAAGLNLDDLPTLNRDLRIIGGQLPGFREASRLLFTLRRGVRAQQRGREAEALLGIDPELAGQLSQAALIGRVALLVIIVTTLARSIDKMRRDIVKARADNETLLRRGLDLTHQEFLELSAEQKGVTSRFDAFERLVIEDRDLEAITVFLRDFFKRVTPTGPFIPFEPGVRLQGEGTPLFDILPNLSADALAGLLGLLEDLGRGAVMLVDDPSNYQLDQSDGGQEDE